MIHIIFNRPQANLKCFDANGNLWQDFKAAGDSWGWTAENPYGFDGWCPPGHFVLGAPQVFETPIPSEGFGQIPVLDMTSAVLGTLVQAEKAVEEDGLIAIGGLSLPIGQLVKYGRSAIMIHGGGSNSPNPLTANQGLFRTDGCTRMLNGDWQRLASYLSTNEPGNTVVYTIFGNPLRLEN